MGKGCGPCCVLQTHPLASRSRKNRHALVVVSATVDSVNLQTFLHFLVLSRGFRPVLLGFHVNLRTLQGAATQDLQVCVPVIPGLDVARGFLRLAQGANGEPCKKNVR